MKIQVGISNRHVHLKQEDLKKLFGENYELEKAKDLNQPGQFASTSFVTLLGPKGKIENVRIIGPVRDYTQVEISKTDAFKLGLNPPVRSAGDIIDSSPITIINNDKKIDLEYGCIIADRHIHITPEQMKYYNFEGKEKVNVLINGEKGGIITNVKLKVNELSYLELHLDTDDANAHLVKQGDIVEILEEGDN